MYNCSYFEAVTDLLIFLSPIDRDIVIIECGIVHMLCSLMVWNHLWTQEIVFIQFNILISSIVVQNETISLWYQVWVPLTAQWFCLHLCTNIFLCVVFDRLRRKILQMFAIIQTLAPKCIKFNLLQKYYKNFDNVHARILVLEVMNVDQLVQRCYTSLFSWSNANLPIIGNVTNNSVFHLSYHNCNSHSNYSCKY